MPTGSSDPLLPVVRSRDHVAQLHHGIPCHHISESWVGWMHHLFLCASKGSHAERLSDEAPSGSRAEEASRYSLMQSHQPVCAAASVPAVDQAGARPRCFGCCCRPETRAPAQLRVGQHVIVAKIWIVSPSLMLRHLLQRIRIIRNDFQTGLHRRSSWRQTAQTASIQRRQRLKFHIGAETK